MALEGHLADKVKSGQAHWVTVKEGPLQGRHLLIDGARSASGEAGKGKILAGKGIPLHVIEKLGGTHAHHLDDYEHTAHDDKTGEPIPGKKPEDTAKAATTASGKPVKEKPVSKQFPKWQTKMGNDFLNDADWVMGEDKAKNKELAAILNEHGYDKAMEYVRQNENLPNHDQADHWYGRLDHYANKDKKKGLGTGEPYQEPEKVKKQPAFQREGWPGPPKDDKFEPVHDADPLDVKFVNPWLVKESEEAEKELDTRAEKTKKETGRRMGYGRLLRIKGKTYGHIQDYNWYGGGYAVAHLDNGQNVVAKNQKQLREKLRQHPYLVEQAGTESKPKRQAKDKKDPFAIEPVGADIKVQKHPADNNNLLVTLDGYHRHGVTLEDNGNGKYQGKINGAKSSPNLDRETAVKWAENALREHAKAAGPNKNMSDIGKETQPAKPAQRDELASKRQSKKPATDQLKMERLRDQASQLHDRLSHLHKQGYINDHHLWQAGESRRLANSYAQGMLHADTDAQRAFHERTANGHVNDLFEMWEKARQPHIKAQKLIDEAAKHGETIRKYNAQQRETHGGPHESELDEHDLKTAEKLAAEAQKHMQTGEGFNRWDYEDTLDKLERKLRGVRQDAKIAKKHMNKSTGAPVYSFGGRLLVKRR